MSIARQPPDRAFRAGEAADVEGIDADQLAWSLGLDVALGLGRSRRLVGCGVIRTVGEMT